jgi:ABC-type transporter Mla subunit MlaD
MSDKNAEVKVIVSADITGVKPGIDAVNAQLRSMSERAKVTSNETFALFDKIDTGAKRASQQTQQAARSFTALQSEVNKTSGFFDKHTYALQNASYQLTSPCRCRTARGFR